MSEVDFTTNHPATAAMDWLEIARAASADDDALEAEMAAQQELELLVVHCGDAAYGIPVSRVREIIRIRSLTPVPRSPGWMLGVVSLRGEMVEVLDLRSRLDAACEAPTRKSRIVILSVADEQIAGVLVDGVDSVFRFPESELLPAPESDSGSIEHMVLRDQEFVSILDLERVLEVGDA